MKIKLLSAFLVLFTAIGFVACDTEPVDQNIVNQEPDDNNGGGNNGGGNNGGGNNGGGSATGDYWPFAINNQWEFESSVPQNDEPMKIIGTETINNVLYYRINYAFQDPGTGDLAGTAVLHLRKDNNAYYQRVQVNIPGQNGMETTVSPYELLIFKDVEVGQSWTYTATQITTYQSTDPDITVDLPDNVMTIDLTGTVLEKDISLTVNGATYSNVIKVKVVQDITVHEWLGMPEMITTTTTNMWFSKGVGPIKFETSTSLGNEVTRELVSYTVN